MTAPHRTRDNTWTARELAMAQECASRGLRPTTCLPLFPRRSTESVQSKFTQLRRPDDGARRLASAADLAEIEALYLHFPDVPKKAPPGSREPVNPFKGFEQGCAQLLRRQLETGQHNITCPARFSAACEAVGLRARG
jgi:hypothetical protein